MPVLRQIALQTMRASLRSHLVQVLLGLLLIAVVVVPLTIKGEGTAQSLVQVSLTYTLGFVGILLSLSALWLGCTVIAEEIETYQLHMVTVKPVSRATIWLGKWLGIVCLQGVLLAVAVIAILGLLYWRLWRGQFPDQQVAKVQQEVLVGRRLFSPELPDVDRLAAEDVRKELANRPPNTPGLGYGTLMESKRREKWKALEELPPGQGRGWVFRGLPRLAPGETLTLRYRMFVDRAKSRDQPVTQGVWFVPIKRGDKVEPLPLFSHDARAGVFHEQALPAWLIDPQTKQPVYSLVQPDGTLALIYMNLDPNGQKVVFQRDDGPHLLMRVSGFVTNYARVVLLVYLQIMFLAALGCACGAGLHTPVALFLAFTYLVVGAVIAIMPFGEWEYEPPPPGVLQRVNYEFNTFMAHLNEQPTHYKPLFLVRMAAETFVVPVNEFNEVTRLTKGELIEVSRMLLIFGKMIVLRGLPMALLGIWVLQRRELGLVVRR